jgi:hypothetical protein
LVRTKARSALLSCARTDAAEVRRFVAGFPFAAYYLHECSLLREYWHILNGVLHLGADSAFELQNLEAVLEDQSQLILFFDDFMQIDPHHFSHCFINAFANECMVYLLEALTSSMKTTFSLKIVLLIAAILVNNIHNQLFSDFLIFCLFGKYYTTILRDKLMCAIEKPTSYSKEWKFKGFWDTHEDTINEYCAKVYFGNAK